jgi:hypothetical protein
MISKDPGPHPALRLLINHCPRRQIAGHETPLVAGAHHVAKAVEDRPQRVLALWRVLAAQGQVRSYKRPLLIAYIARILRRVLLLHLFMLREKTALSSTF